MKTPRKTTGWRKTVAISAAFFASLAPIMTAQDDLRDNEPLYMRDMNRLDGPTCTTIAELRALAEKDPQELVKCALFLMKTPYRGILDKYGRSNVERNKIIDLRLTLEKTVIPIATQFLKDSDEKKDIEFLSQLNDTLLKGLIHAGEVRDAEKGTVKPTLQRVGKKNINKDDIDIILDDVRRFNKGAKEYAAAIQKIKETTTEAIPEVDAILVGVVKLANEEYQNLFTKGDKASKQEKARMDEIRKLMVFIFQTWFQDEKIKHFREAANALGQQGLLKSSSSTRVASPTSVTRQPSIASLGGGSPPKALE